MMMMMMIDSELRLFADDCVCYRDIKDTEDTVKLQEDIDHLRCWARSLGMRFQPVKCNIMQITRKRIKKISASYSLEGTVLENVEKIKFLLYFSMNYGDFSVKSKLIISLFQTVKLSLSISLFQKKKDFRVIYSFSC